MTITVNTNTETGVVELFGMALSPLEAKALAARLIASADFLDSRREVA